MAIKTRLLLGKCFFPYMELAMAFLQVLRLLRERRVLLQLQLHQLLQQPSPREAEAEVHQAVP